MENKISVCLATVYNNNRQVKIINELGDRLCRSYSYGFPRCYKYTDEPIDKMYLTKIPRRISGFIISKLVNLFNLPRYYTFWACWTIFDWMVANKVANDSSMIVFTSTLCPRTIKACKAKGKIVIIEAGNSEPKREYDRITAEYSKFGIKHIYLYGDKEYQYNHIEILRYADIIVSISEVSMKTYVDAGILQEKIKLIPLTGCPWEVDVNYSPAGRSKAFITTGFHSFIKGTQRLLLAWKKSGIQNIPLIVVGAICEDMKEFIAKYGPFDNVQYKGLLSLHELRTLYGTYSACGVLLSLSEGAGRVTPEMMSFGFPMVVSPDATCDLVVDGVNGFIVDPADEGTIAKRLGWLAEDWSRVESMNQVVLNSVKSRSMEDYAVEVAQFLLNINT